MIIYIFYLLINILTTRGLLHARVIKCFFLQKIEKLKTSVLALNKGKVGDKLISQLLLERTSSSIYLNYSYPFSSDRGIDAEYK